MLNEGQEQPSRQRREGDRIDSETAQARLFRIKDRLSNSVLVVGTLAILPVLIASLSRISATGLLPAHFIQALVIVGLCILTLFRHRLPYAVRAAAVPVVIFVAASSGIFSFGLLGSGYGGLAVSAILATVLFGRGVGLWFLGAALVVGLIVLWLHHQGLMVPPFDLTDYYAHSRTWIVRTIGMLVMAIIVIAPIGFLTSALYGLVTDLATRERELEASNADKDAAINELMTLKATLEARVDAQTSGLRRAKEQAESANRAKTDFLNIVSHELRTPLTVVLGYSKALFSVSLLPQVKELHARIEDGTATTDDLELAINRVREIAHKMDASGEHLLGLINDLLDFAKIEAGKMDLQIAEVNLGDSVATVVEQMGDKAKEKGLALEMDVADDVIVQGDVLRLRQILINLIGNAIKFTDAGKVQVEVRPGAGFCECRVRDTGRGIAGDDTDAIFDRFHQLEDSLTRQAGGTGLGLAITKKLVEAHGGEVHARNHPDGGAEFVFTINSDPV